MYFSPEGSVALACWSDCIFHLYAAPIDTFLLNSIYNTTHERTLPSDTIDPVTNRISTRWQEAQRRLKEMIEILAYVPFSEIIVCFLNRTDTLHFVRQGRNPKAFLADAYR